VKPQGVVLFFTTSSALRAERVLLDANFTVKLIPTPRELSSDCGIACRFEWEERQRVKRTLDEAHVEISAVKEMETA
jgi:hypothetical protein